MPIAAIAAIGAVGSIATGAMGAHAAGSAADAQVAAANHAADLQHADAQAALAFQKQQYNTSQKNAAPWLNAGTGAINTLYSDLKNGKYGDWTGSFTAPTAAEAAQDPGYAFRVSEGLKGIDRGAAARGGILTGGTLKAEQQFGQDMASQEYGNVYNRRFQEYLQKYGEFNNNQTNDFNRYASIAGVGQQAATSTAQIGQQAANNVGSILLQSGNDQAAGINNAAAARASGYIGGANSWTGAVGGVNSALSQYMLYSQLNKTPGTFVGMSG
jgi:hypothetical protein